jgi:hypothetical protein
VPVLITGESGTGKELVAHAIYQHGPGLRLPSSLSTALLFRRTCSNSRCSGTRGVPSRGLTVTASASLSTTTAPRGVQPDQRPQDGSAKLGVTCLDCHVNGHTSGQFHINPDDRPEQRRLRLDTVSLRGLFNQQIHGSKLPTAGHQGHPALSRRRPLPHPGGHGRVLQPRPGAKADARGEEGPGSVHAAVVTAYVRVLAAGISGRPRRQRDIRTWRRSCSLVAVPGSSVGPHRPKKWGQIGGSIAL